MREKIPRDEVPRGREGGGAERGNSLDGIDHSTFRMETTERGRRRLWNSFSLNWALKAVKESCCRLPSLAGSCQMNPGKGMNGSGTCMNFGTDLPAPTSRFVELGLGKSGRYYFLPLDLNWSRQVSIAVIF